MSLAKAAAVFQIVGTAYLIWIGYEAASSGQVKRSTADFIVAACLLIAGIFCYKSVARLESKKQKETLAPASSTDQSKLQIHNLSLPGRTEKIALDLLRFLKEQGPEPEKPSSDSDQQWLIYADDKAEHNRKVDSLYLAYYASTASTIRHELRAYGVDMSGLDGLVDNPYHDHGRVHDLAVRLLQISCAMRTDELIKSIDPV